MGTRSLDPRLVGLLVCPDDKGPLIYVDDASGLVNPRLARRYPVRNGIPVMLIDEAESMSDDEVAAAVAHRG
jgi:uncharacterized protein YbaR (Trm112 family)